MRLVLSRKVLNKVSSLNGARSICALGGDTSRCCASRRRWNKSARSEYFSCFVCHRGSRVNKARTQENDQSHITSQTVMIPSLVSNLDVFVTKTCVQSSSHLASCADENAPSVVLGLSLLKPRTRGFCQQGGDAVSSVGSSSPPSSCSSCCC